MKAIDASGVSAISSLQAAELNFKTEILKGPAMLPYLEELAKLEVLYEGWPYFCQANLAEDTDGIRRIMEFGGLASVAFDMNGKIIGAAMGRPQELVSCVNGAFPGETGVFHMQHWLVLPEYQNQKVGNAIYEKLENYIKASREPSYDRISCATVIRPDNFRLPKPVNAYSVEDSLEHRGFTRFKPEKEFFFEYTLIDESSDTKHPMVLWMKNLRP